MAQITKNSDLDQPLAVTVSEACRLSSFGPTSIWAFLRDGRLEAVRVPGVRRTLITFRSLAKLLAPPTASEAPRRRGPPRKAERQPQHTAPTLSPRRRGRPRKTAAQLQSDTAPTT